jgi:hypothetical protein
VVVNKNSHRKSFAPPGKWQTSLTFILALKNLKITSSDFRLIINNWLHLMLFYFFSYQKYILKKLSGRKFMYSARNYAIRAELLKFQSEYFPTFLFIPCVDFPETN